jgi:hypothetical protein
LQLQSKRSREQRWYEERPARDALETELSERLRKDFGEAFRNTNANIPILRQLAASKLTWVGSLQRDASGAISSVLSNLPIGNGKLVVVRQSVSKQSMVRFEDIGEISQGDAKLTIASPGLLAGRPVFFIPTTK